MFLTGQKQFQKCSQALPGAALRCHVYRAVCPGALKKHPGALHPKQLLDPALCGDWGEVSGGS